MARFCHWLSSWTGIVPGYEHKQLYLEDEAVPPLQSLGLVRQVSWLRCVEAFFACPIVSLRKDAMATDVLFPSSMPDPKGQVPRSRL